MGTADNSRELSNRDHPMAAMLDHTHVARRVGWGDAPPRIEPLSRLRAWSETLSPGDQVSPCRFEPKTLRCLASILGSGGIQPPRAAHLSLLQDNTNRASGALLSLCQWEGEKEGISVGAARRTNAAGQAAGKFADDRQSPTAPDGFRSRAIVGDPAPYDVACKLQLHSQFRISSVELCVSCHIGQQFGYDQPKSPAAPTFKSQIIR